MIGNTVWKKFGNSNLRIGKVIEEDKCGNWTYVRVDWIDDDAFEMDRKRVIELRGYDKYSDWYRCDAVHSFDKEEILNKINKL